MILSVWVGRQSIDICSGCRWPCGPWPFGQCRCDQPGRRAVIEAAVFVHSNRPWIPWIVTLR